MGPSTAIRKFSVPPLHLPLNKVGQLLVAVAEERVLSLGQEKSMYGFTIYIVLVYKPPARRIAQVVCGDFLSFYIFVFHLLLIRDLVHETGDFMLPLPPYLLLNVL